MYVGTDNEYLKLKRGEIVLALTLQDRQDTKHVDGVMDARVTHLKNVVSAEVVGGMSTDAAVKAASF